MNITVKFKAEHAASTGVGFVSRQYLGTPLNVQTRDAAFMICLLDLLVVSGATSADIESIEVTG